MVKGKVADGLRPSAAFLFVYRSLGGTYGSLKDGSAVITPAFNMTNAKHIIHAVGPDFGRTPAAFKELFEAYYTIFLSSEKGRYRLKSTWPAEAAVFGSQRPRVAFDHLRSS